MECNMYLLTIVFLPKDALEALQSILEQLKKDMDILNEAMQQQWALKDSVDALTPLSAKSTPYTPISIPIEGLLSNVMICSRCGSRRQIRNVPFFSLSIPIARSPLFPPFLSLETPPWRLDPSSRHQCKLFYRLLTDTQDFVSPVHPTLLDCLRQYTAPDDVDDVQCEGSPPPFPSILAADCSTPCWTPPLSQNSPCPAIPSRWVRKTAVMPRNFEKNSRIRCIACGRRTISTRSFTCKTRRKRSA